MTQLATYSPEEINILVAGVVPLTGLAAGSFLTISKNLQPFVTQRTSDGDVARLLNNDNTYSISITLHQGSEDNEILTKLSLLDKTSLKGIFPLFIKDLIGTTFFYSSSTWIESEPDQEFSDTLGTLTWVLRSSQAITNIGSNVAPSGLLEDILNTLAASAPVFAEVISGI